MNLSAKKLAKKLTKKTWMKIAKDFGVNDEDVKRFTTLKREDTTLKREDTTLNRENIVRMIRGKNSGRKFLKMFDSGTLMQIINVFNALGINWDEWVKAIKEGKTMEMFLMQAAKKSPNIKTILDLHAISKFGFSMESLQPLFTNTSFEHAMKNLMKDPNVKQKVSQLFAEQK
jgi:hypothetical protein